MPSYRERREAGEFASGEATKYEPEKPALEAVQEAVEEEGLPDAEPEPAPKPKRTGVKVTDAE